MPFRYERPDGTAIGPVGLVELMARASARLVAGRGPFDVVLDEHYHHKDLSRARALLVFRSLVDEAHPGDDVRIRTEERSVFHARRVTPDPDARYLNPLRDVVGLRQFRQDMGCDYAATKRSPIYAIGPGEVTRVDEHASWPGERIICYRLTKGPARNLCVFLAEHLELGSLQVGDPVDAETVIATLLPGFPNCEMGWADERGFTAEAVPYYREGDRTAHGDNFSRFLVALGAPPATIGGRSITGKLPSKYSPNWRDEV